MENANNELLLRIIKLFEKSIFRLIHISGFEHELLSIDNNIIDNIGHYKEEIRKSLEKKRQEDEEREKREKEERERLAEENVAQEKREKEEQERLAEENVAQEKEQVEVDKKKKLKDESDKLLEEGEKTYTELSEKNIKQQQEISRKDEEFKEFLNEFKTVVPAANYFEKENIDSKGLQDIFNEIFSDPPVANVEGEGEGDVGGVGDVVGVGGGQIRTLKKKRRRNKI